MEIAQNSPAYFAGILPGDRIVSIDGRGIGNSNDVNFILQTNLGSDVPWVLERNGQSIVLNLVPRYQPPPGQGASGVTLANEIVSISNVTFSSSADQIGFKVGDTLLSWGDMPVNAENHISLISELLSEREEGIINVRVWRENKIVSLAVPSSLNISTSGFEFSTKPMETQSYSLWEAIYKSVIHTKDILVLAKNEVTTWLIGARSPQLTGPIGIAQLTGEVARSGVSSLVEFTALLSINLAILNILPIPALDGGRIFFVVLEWLRGGKRIAPEREGFVHLIGFVVLLTMIAIISYRDIARIIQGEGIL
jgi:regulator of sigma E protease